VFWFNTFFIDMHLLQQRTYHQRSSSHKLAESKLTDHPDHLPSDRHSSSTSSDLAMMNPPRKSGHHRNRSGTPATDSVSVPKSKSKQRATSPSASMLY